MKSAILLDSTAGLSEELIARDNIFQVNLLINFDDGEQYVDTGADKRRRNTSINA